MTDENDETNNDGNNTPPDLPNDPPESPPAPPETPADDTPGWARELIDKVDELQASVTAVAPPEPVTPSEPVADVVDDGPDESPVKAPWTHRRIL